MAFQRAGAGQQAPANTAARGFSRTAAQVGTPPFAAAGNTALQPQAEKSVTYKANGEDITLSLEDIRTYFCPDATPKECMMFLTICSRNGFDPYLREAYLIKYDKNAAAAIVVGKDAFLKRAEANPAFDGFEAGIMVYRAETGEIEAREGCAYFSNLGEQLIGGWAKVYRKDCSRPYFEQVSLAEYNKKQSKWNEAPGTMIRKVALSHALREAFPSVFSGIYDESEILVDAEGTARELDEPALPARRRRMAAPKAPAVEIVPAAAPDELQDAAADSEDDPFGGVEP